MKFQSKPVEEHDEVPPTDEGRWEDLIARWAQHEQKPQSREKNATYVVSVWPGKGDAEAQLAEVIALVRAQGDAVVGRELITLERQEPKTLLRRGQAEGVATRAMEMGANLIVLDAELSPSQTRNLEDLTGLAVADREVIILNVFVRHARTKKARIQVEIAQLQYLRPRIRGLGLDMDQQAAGIGAARGPGETASEMMSRRLDQRLAELKRALARLGRSGAEQRKGRGACHRVALVGYTNAGKTSLMNALTSAGLSAENVPFETLDTTTRALTRHGGDVLLSDTVGFIRRLPNRLMESFESTLAEVCESSLMALVVDVSDPERALHLETTEAVLSRLDANAIPRFYVFNKVDRLAESPADSELEALSQGHPYFCLSSFDANAVAHLEQLLLRAVRRDRKPRRLFVPYEATEILSTLYARCRVLHAEPSARGIRFTIDAEPRWIAKLERLLRGER